MSSAEIKNEIQKILNSVPEDALVNVLDYLKDVENYILKENVDLFLKELHNKHASLLSKLAK